MNTQSPIQMSLSPSRITANKVVAHVHFASKTTKFNLSFDNNAGQYVVYCANDDNRTTCEFFVGPNVQTVNLIHADLTKLGYAEFF